MCLEKKVWFKLRFRPRIQVRYNTVATSSSTSLSVTTVVVCNVSNVVWCKGEISVLLICSSAVGFPLEREVHSTGKKRYWLNPTYITIPLIFKCVRTILWNKRNIIIYIYSIVRIMKTKEGKMCPATIIDYQHATVFQKMIKARRIYSQIINEARVYLCSIVACTWYLLVFCSKLIKNNKLS